MCLLSSSPFLSGNFETLFDLANIICPMCAFIMVRNRDSNPRHHLAVSLLCLAAYYCCEWLKWGRWQWQWHLTTGAGQDKDRVLCFRARIFNWSLGDQGTTVITIIMTRDWIEFAGESRFDKITYFQAFWLQQSSMFGYLKSAPLFSHSGLLAFTGIGKWKEHLFYFMPRDSHNQADWDKAGKERAASILYPMYDLVDFMSRVWRWCW